MEIKRCGSRPSGKGSAEYFTGLVRIDPLFDASNPPGRERRERDLRARRTNGMAYSSARPDADRHGMPWPDTTLGRSGRGNPARRRRLGSSGGEALARCKRDRRHDAHCHSRGAGWQGRRLARKGQRRAVHGIEAVEPDITLWIILLVITITMVQAPPRHGLGNRHGYIRRHRSGSDKSVYMFCTKAAMYYLQAAQKGYAPAQYDLAYLYEQGLGVKQDLRQAAL
jgi:hypothetical protein